MRIYGSEVTGSLRVKGDVFAENYIVKTTVSTITQSFSSGSTIFGDSFDDTHQFTGSLKVSGSTRLEGEVLSFGASGTTNNTNLIIGYEAGENITTANYNTLYGYRAGKALIDESSNVAIGNFNEFK